MSFGQKLRRCRRQCHDPLRGGMLTQERLGELIGDVMGDAGYSGAAVSDWERDKSKIHADDRRVLTALLTVFHQCGGIKHVDQANELLAEGNYRSLDVGESTTIFPGQKVESLTAQPWIEARGERRQDKGRSFAARSRAEKILLEKVEHFWVDGVLRKSMAGTPQLTLSKCLVEEAVDQPWETSVGPAFLAREEIPADVDILQLFYLAERALLILGSPGSGKTTTLISLASSLLDAAHDNSQAPMPIVLDLSGWAKERQDLPHWIVEELTAKYQIPRRYGRRWLENDELVLLLDGFDVLPPQAREPCIKAINRFRETNGLSGLAICSRSEEYLACGLKFRLNSAVKIAPLDGQQIENYLSAAEYGRLRQIIGQDAAIAQLAQSPLMLNVLAAVSAGEPTVEEEPALEAATVSDRALYASLFNAYTRRMFRRRPSAGPYGADQTVSYLQWLAGRLEEHSQTIFLIEGIQPSWLPTKRWRWVYMLLCGAFLGLAGGLIMWLLWRLLRHTLPQLPAAVSAVIAGWFNLTVAPVELVTILLGNLALGLLVCVILALFFEARRVVPPAADQINRQRWLQVWAVGLVCGTVTAFFISFFTDWLLSIAWGVAEGFMYMAAARFIFGWSYESDVRPVEALGWSWQRALTGSAIGIILTLIAETVETILYGYNGFSRTLLTLVLAGFILGGLTGSRTTAKSRPNQGVWLSLRNAGWAALLVSIPLALLTGILRDVRYAQIIGALTALIAAALFGLSVFVKHFLLRGLLRLQRNLPWRYTRFLDHAAQLVFLRKVGGGYIFLHRLLQQYFAAYPIEVPESGDLETNV